MNYEELDLKQEKEKLLKEMVKDFPDRIREEVKDHLMVEFNLVKLSDKPNIKKKLYNPLGGGKVTGGRWNKVVSFYENFQTS